MLGHLCSLIFLKFLLEFITDRVRTDSETTHEVDRLRVELAVILEFFKRNHTVHVCVHFISYCFCLEEAFLEYFQCISYNFPEVLSSHASTPCRR